MGGDRYLQRRQECKIDGSSGPLVGPSVGVSISVGEAPKCPKEPKDALIKHLLITRYRVFHAKAQVPPLGLPRSEGMSK